MSIISDSTKYSRLAFGLRGFLRGTITLEQSKKAVTKQHRESVHKDFVSVPIDRLIRNNNRIRGLILTGLKFFLLFGIEENPRFLSRLGLRKHR